MTYHFVENFKAVILVPYSGHLDQNSYVFRFFAKNRKKSFFREKAKKMKQIHFTCCFSLSNMTK
jgi:hypothetical protein